MGTTWATTRLETVVPRERPSVFVPWFRADCPTHPSRATPWVIGTHKDPGGLTHAPPPDRFETRLELKNHPPMLQNAECISFRGEATDLGACKSFFRGWFRQFSLSFNQNGWTFSLSVDTRTVAGSFGYLASLLGFQAGVFRNAGLKRCFRLQTAPFAHGYSFSR